MSDSERVLVYDFSDDDTAMAFTIFTYEDYVPLLTVQVNINGGEEVEESEAVEVSPERIEKLADFFLTSAAIMRGVGKEEESDLLTLYRDMKANPDDQAKRLAYFEALATAYRDDAERYLDELNALRSAARRVIADCEAAGVEPFGLQKLRELVK